MFWYEFTRLEERFCVRVQVLTSKKQAELLVGSVDGDITFVRNVRKLLPDYTMSHPTRQS
jgi:hypothetical protein